jgi:hypothetical protein
MALTRAARLRRARRPRVERRTYVLAAVALMTTGAVAIGELSRVWRRGSAPLPAEAEDLLSASAEAARETVEVVVEGYREVSARENALLNLLLSFVLTFAVIRGAAHTIRSHGAVGPFRNIILRERHIHHFVPGIALALLAGGTGIVVRDEDVRRWLAIPFGIGAGLTLDESALLLELDDVYWTQRGVVSVEITLATIAMLASLMLALRVLRRGEEAVLERPPASGAAPSG